MLHRPTREQHSDQVYAAITGHHPELLPPDEIESGRWRVAAAWAQELRRGTCDLLHSASIHPLVRAVIARAFHCAADLRGRLLRG